MGWAYVIEGRPLNLCCPSDLTCKGMIEVDPICKTRLVGVLPAPPAFLFFLLSVCASVALTCEAGTSVFSLLSTRTQPSKPGKQMTATNQCWWSLMGTTMKSFSKMFTFLVHRLTRSYLFSSVSFQVLGQMSWNLMIFFTINGVPGSCKTILDGIFLSLKCQKWQRWSWLNKILFKK